VRRGTTVLATSVAAFGVEVWRYIEFKVVCNDTTGSYELRIGEETVLSATDVDTKAGTHDYHDSFRFYGAGLTDADATIIDDCYILDGSGTLNDFLGNVRVLTIRPNAAGDTTEWAPSAGDNYAAVDEEVCDDDTSYVEDDTADQTDLYNYGAISATAGVIGVQVNTDCRETDATSFSLKTVCKSGATTDADAGQAIGSASYVTRTRILETDPDTAAAWTAGGVNAAQFGVKVKVA
jgi:hypothetical protein